MNKDYSNIAGEIINLKEEDLALRDRLIQSGELSDGYNVEMEALHNRNAGALDEIMDSIGYPTRGKVGEKASEAAWLIIQHSISQPEFMKKCAGLLEEAVIREEANPMNLVYLTDRIAVYEDKPQLYGTQFDWDESGRLSPKPYDDLAKVNQRRKSVKLNTLEEQTQIMRKRAAIENQFPLVDFEKRRREYDEWRKRVGWV